MKHYRITVKVTDDTKGEVYDDELVTTAADFEEAARLASAWAHGRRRDPSISEVEVRRIEINR